jgi:hypothetical protein
MIADLWRRRCPDALVFLDASLGTVRRRRGAAWPHWIYDLQIDRLSHARSHATVLVDTGISDPEGTVGDIVAALSSALE